MQFPRKRGAISILNEGLLYKSLLSDITGARSFHVRYIKNYTLDIRALYSTVYL